ncbi:MAG: type II toxin-antitoxin system RelE/ParE family toxin [Sphingorhabdus sp.]
MSQARFVLRAAAQRDIDSLADYLETEAGKEVAQRFIDAAQASFVALAAAPHLGPAVPTKLTDLAGLRKWRVSGFSNVLIFYRPENERIRIFRVLHGAQDWLDLLDVANGDT